MIVYLQTHIFAFAGNYHSYNAFSLPWTISAMQAAPPSEGNFLPIRDPQVIKSTGLTVTETLIRDPINAN